MTIITRRDIRVLLSAYLFAGWMLFISLFALLIMHEMGIWALVIVSPFLIFGVLHIRNYYKKAPIITIDEEKILFNSECFLWRDLKQINLMHEKPADEKIDFLEREGVRFIFNNGMVKYMYDEYYSNSEMAKLFLEQVVYNHQDEVEVPIIERAGNLTEYTFTTFKGANQPFPNMILFVAVVNFIDNFGSIDVAHIFGYIGTMSFIISMALNINYFLVSKRLIVIKKYHIPWVKTIYNLKNIREVVITKQNKIDCLKIIRKDFVSETFYAFGFSKKQWHQLQRKIEASGIQVENFIDLKA